MKQFTKRTIAAFCVMALLLAGCGSNAASTAETESAVMETAVAETETTAETEKSGTETAESASADDQIATAAEMTTPEDVVEDWMQPINGNQIQDGVYDIKVDSSSSMFNIMDCQLLVQDGNMTAVMTMSGTGYLYLYMGTGEEAVQASEDTYIPYKENAEGAHTYTVPVEALDKGIACAAFSKNKDKWYDRTLVFRADSLPTGAFAKGMISAPEDLDLADGTYEVEVTLTGGSGKASVASPAKITVSDEKIQATIIFSSANYDYVLVDGEKYLNEATEGNSTFTIPVSGFDWKMPVTADTTAMSTPHEIDYSLYFDSATITEVQE